MGIATLGDEYLEQQQATLEAAVAQWRTLPAAAILLAFAVVPAVCEELFFRGYLLAALRPRMNAWAAVGLSSLIFGVFHACVGGVVQVEHVLGSTFLGLALGWVAWQSRSVLPGMLLHGLNNGIMLSIVYYKPQIQQLGWDLEQQRYLPAIILVPAVVGAVIGAGLIWLGRTRGTCADAAAQPTALPLTES
jgi:ABC-2 type transport system permease protein/sodium transport system permease protein